MELPKINNLPVHTLHLQVLDKDITFSPFTVFEEKGYITAISDGTTEDVLNNYLMLAKSCVNEELDWKNLTLIDFITIAINIRAKSQGESLELQKKECKKCGKLFPFTVNIEDSLKFENVEKLKSIVEIDENLKIEINPLNVNYLYDFDNFEDETDIFIATIVYSISKIFFNDQIYTNLKYEEIKENCVQNLSKKQIQKIIDEISNLISLKLEFEIECPHCKEVERLSIKNFLEFLK